MIVAAGEALVDLTPTNFGSEQGYVPHPGGSPYNVAVGLGRLGVPTSFLGRISDDPFGRLLRQHLLNSGVDLGLVINATEQTAVAIVHIGDGEPEYSFYSEGTADRLLYPHHLPHLPDGAGLHVGSISLVLEPAATTLEGLIRRESHNRFISLDPNVRTGLIGDLDAYRERLASWVTLVDLVKVSAADLISLYPNERPEDVADRWLSAGPALVVVTFGGKGAYARNRNGAVHAPSPKVVVADTVGAGDAFTAGALAHLHDRKWLTHEELDGLRVEDMERLLLDANAVAADTCTRKGAEPPRRRSPPGLPGPSSS